MTVPPPEFCSGLELGFSIIGIGDCLERMDVSLILLMVLATEQVFLKGKYRRFSKLVWNLTYIEIVASLMFLGLITARVMFSLGPVSADWLVIPFVIGFVLFLPIGVLFINTGDNPEIAAMYLISAFLVYLTHRFVYLYTRTTAEA